MVELLNSALNHSGLKTPDCLGLVNIPEDKALYKFAKRPEHLTGNQPDNILISGYKDATNPAHSPVRAHDRAR